MKVSGVRSDVNVARIVTNIPDIFDNTDDNCFTQLLLARNCSEEKQINEFSHDKKQNSMSATTSSGLITHVQSVANNSHIDSPLLVVHVKTITQ